MEYVELAAGSGCQRIVLKSIPPWIGFRKCLRVAGSVRPAIQICNAEFRQDQPKIPRIVIGAASSSKNEQYFNQGIKIKLPSCQRPAFATIAVINLESTPAGTTCGRFNKSSRLPIPNPTVHSTAPFSTTATETAGVLLAAIKREMAASSWARFSGAIWSDSAAAVLPSRKWKIKKIAQIARITRIAVGWLQVPRMVSELPNISACRAQVFGANGEVHIHGSPIGVDDRVHCALDVVGT